MDFQKAIQIKSLFNEFNQIRNERNQPRFVFDATMFDIGSWAVDVIIPSEACLYSRECAALFPMLSQMGVSFFIGFHNNRSKIYIQ